MGYSTQTEVVQILANALARANPAVNGPSPITSIGNTLTSTVATSDFIQFMRWADQQIDGAIGNMYQVPLKRVNVGNYQLAMDVTAGDMQVVLDDATFFLPEDIVVIRDSSGSQELSVLSIPDDNTLTFAVPVSDSYLAVSARVQRIRYPDPIPQVSSMLAASKFYDKYFAAQVEGNKSEYGNRLKNDAYDSLDQVLSGVIRLVVPDANNYTGKRFYNPALDDVINTSAEAGKSWFKKGQ